MMNATVDPRDMAELIDLFFKCIKAPDATEEQRHYGAVFKDKLEACLDDPDSDEMRAFAREISALGTINYTRAFIDLVQLRLRD